MTGSLRSTARNPIAVALMGFLVLIFLILGVSGGGGRLPDALKGIDPNSVISAGQHTVSAQDFKKAWDRQKDSIDQRAGQPVPLNFLVERGVDQQIVNQMAQEQAELEMLRRSGITPGDAQVDAEIKKLPFAVDRVTGLYNERQFTSFLAQQGMTPRQAQTEIRDELAHRAFGFAIEAGFRTPRLYAALSAVQGLENRDVSFFVMDQQAVPMPAPPTDAQLQAFMKAHAAELTVPETRLVTLVLFSAKAAAPTLTVDPAAVQKEFDFKKDSLSSPETRTIVQIPVKTAAQGAEASVRLARGEDPGAVAATYGAQPIVYEDKPQSAIADRKLAVAAFALKAGEVSGAVQGDLGLGVLKVIKVTPGKVATLATARPQIETDLRAKLAQDKVYDTTQKFEDARDAGATIADAAAKSGAVAMTVGPLTAQGTDADGKPIPGLSEKIVKAIFAASGGGAGSDVTNTEPGEYYAFRVDRIIPAAVPPLESKRPQLTQAYMRETLIAALKAKADALMAQMRKGGTIEAAAAQVGGHVSHQVGMQPIRIQQYQALGRDVLQGVFSEKPGAVFADGGPGGIFIVKLDAVRSGEVMDMARAVQVIGPKVNQEYVSDVEAAVRDAAQAAIKPRTNLTLARQAIGVDQATLDKLNAKPGAKPGAKPAKPSGPAL